MYGDATAGDLADRALHLLLQTEESLETVLQHPERVQQYPSRVSSVMAVHFPAEHLHEAIQPERGETVPPIQGDRTERERENAPRMAASSTRIDGTGRASVTAHFRPRTTLERWQEEMRRDRRLRLGHGEAVRRPTPQEEIATEIPAGLNSPSDPTQTAMEAGYQEGYLEFLDELPCEKSLTRRVSIKFDFEVPDGDDEHCLDQGIQALLELASDVSCPEALDAIAEAHRCRLQIVLSC